MSSKELKDKLKALRSLHSGKAVGKMSPEELNGEIAHHETASRAKELKEKRLTALASAREAKKPAVVETVKKAVAVKKEKAVMKEEKPTVIKKVAKEVVAEKKIKKEKKVVVESDTDSSTDEDTDTETIKKRISKKSLANGE
jgi:hypothetical protein